MNQKPNYWYFLVVQTQETGNLGIYNNIFRNCFKDQPEMLNTTTTIREHNLCFSITSKQLIDAKSMWLFRDIMTNLDGVTYIDHCSNSPDYTNIEFTPKPSFVIAACILTKFNWSIFDLIRPSKYTKLHNQIDALLSSIGNTETTSIGIQTSGRQINFRLTSELPISLSDHDQIFGLLDQEGVEVLSLFAN